MSNLKILIAKYSSENLTPSMAARTIQTYLNRNGYAGLFTQSIETLLSENRRIGRASNVGKYGRLPFNKQPSGQVTYKLEDIQALCEDKLKPICKGLEKAQLERASKASALERLPYAA